MSSAWPTWEQWIEGLGPEDRQRATELAETFRRLGAADPESWARSEVSEDFAQLARYLALRSLWRDAINTWVSASVDRNPIARRLLANGADVVDVVQLARAAAYQGVFVTLFRLTGEGSDPDLDDTDGHLPGWRLMETRDERLTGREVAALHESIPSMDPSGREGSDLRE